MPSRSLVLELGAALGISDNTYRNYDPRVSGSNVVWREFDGNDDEIFFWDGSTITQITDNDTDDSNPLISGSTIVWRGYDGDDIELFMTTVGEDPPIPVPSLSLLSLFALCSGLVCLGARRLR